jgi:hypothetical protein
MFGSEKKRLDRVAAHLKLVVSSLPVSRVNMGEESISIQLYERTFFSVAHSGRGVLSARVLQLNGNDIKASSPEPIATTIHTEDVIAIKILAGVQDALREMSLPDWPGLPGEVAADRIADAQKSMRVITEEARRSGVDL